MPAWFAPSRWLPGRRRYFPLTREYGDAVADWFDQQHRRCKVDYPDPVTAAMCQLLEGSLNTLSLTWSDRLAQRCGVELRRPLFDVNFVELLLAMPREQLHAPGCMKSKPVFRRAVRDILPQAVYQRTQVAEFSGHWIHAMRQHEAALRGLFHDSRLVQLGILDSHYAKSACNTGDDASLYRILDLASLEIWLRQLD